MRVIAAIPARYASTRFPGKPLALISGKPMIQWVVERVRSVRGFADVVVATDDERIRDAAEAAGSRAVMTPARLPTGTDRIAWALKKERFDWVMNIQGDEPLVRPATLRKLIERARRTRESAIITPAAPITERADYLNSNTVKVVFGKDGRALYFSRAPIPDNSRQDGALPAGAFRHVGIYLFHSEAFRRFVRLPQSFLENTEKLEQLRALEAGIPVFVVPVRYHAVNVDLPSDIIKAERCLQGQS